MARVLVVDDEPAIRFFAQLNLELAGHEVLEAGDGAAALAAVERDPPDVVVLDVMLPGVDGFAILERLKSSPDEDVRTVPVVLLTALDGDEHEARGAIEGAIRHLRKPVTPEELLAAVDDVLTGGPEPIQRRRAQTSGLARLARLETGRPATAAPGPRLSRLERVREPASTPQVIGPALGALTDGQRRLVDALAGTGSVADIAAQLGVSRSNVYASLRRIARKLDIDDVPELLRRVRSGAPGG